jgi:hypothetical protein
MATNAQKKAQLRQRVRDMLAGARGSDAPPSDNDLVCEAGCLAEVQRWIGALNLAFFYKDGMLPDKDAWEIHMHYLEDFETVNSATDWLWNRREHFIKKGK